MFSRFKDYLMADERLKRVSIIFLFILPFGIYALYSLYSGYQIRIYLYDDEGPASLEWKEIVSNDKDHKEKTLFHDYLGISIEEFGQNWGALSTESKPDRAPDEVVIVSKPFKLIAQINVWYNFEDKTVYMSHSNGKNRSTSISNYQRVRSYKRAFD